MSSSSPPPPPPPPPACAAALPSSAITSSPASPPPASAAGPLDLDHARAARAAADKQFMATLGACMGSLRDALSAATARQRDDAAHIQAAKRALKEQERLLPHIHAELALLVLLGQQRTAQLPSCDAESRAFSEVAHLAAQAKDQLLRRQRAQQLFLHTMQEKVDTFVRHVESDRRDLRKKLERSYAQAKAEFQRSAEREARTAAARALTSVSYSF